MGYQGSYKKKKTPQDNGVIVWGSNNELQDHHDSTSKIKYAQTLKSYRMDPGERPEK